VVAAVSTFLSKPPVPNPPRRVWRDWVFMAVFGLTALLEGVFRHDVEWRIASTLVALGIAPTVLWRRTHPLAMTIAAFASATVFGVIVAVAGDAYGGLNAVAFVLVMPYALFRWASGRDAAIGAAVMIAAGIGGIALDPGTTLGDAIGGFTMLAILALVGAVTRAETTSRQRELDEVKLRERELLARELHDSVAHHVSAIAVQAQAGRALARTRPQAALEVLAVIEEAASRTLEEMRSMVGTLRNGQDAELEPQQGIGDIHRLVTSTPGHLPVDVQVSGDVTDVRPAVDSAVYRIAQESITNARRHACDASRVVVRVHGGSSAISVEISDDGTARSDDGHVGTGYGLLGMAERAKLLGGTMTAGPDAERGWTVAAEFPRAGVAS
jgi:signal transduction histidine kinase